MSDPTTHPPASETPVDWSSVKGIDRSLTGYWHDDCEYMGFVTLVGWWCNKCGQTGDVSRLEVLEALGVYWYCVNDTTKCYDPEAAKHWSSHSDCHWAVDE